MEACWGQTDSRRRLRRLGTATLRRDRLGSHTAEASATPLLGKIDAACSAIRHRLQRHALDPFRTTEKLKLEHRRRAVVEVVTHFASSLSTAAAPFNGLPAWHHRAPAPAK